MPFNFPALLLSVPKRFSLSTLDNDFKKLAAMEEKKELAAALASMDLGPEQLWPDWDKVETTTSTAAPKQMPVQMPLHDRWGFGRALQPQVNTTTTATLKNLETLDRSTRRPLTAGYDADTEVDSFWAFIHQLMSFESLLIFILAGFVLAWIFKLMCKGAYFAGAKPILPTANAVSTTRVQGQVEPEGRADGQNQGQTINESEPLLGHRPIIYPSRFPYDVIPEARAHAQPPDPALVQVHNYLNA